MPEDKTQIKQTELIFETITQENCPKVTEDLNLHIEKTYRVSGKINLEQ